MLFVKRVVVVVPSETISDGAVLRPESFSVPYVAVLPNSNKISFVPIGSGFYFPTCVVFSDSREQERDRSEAEGGLTMRPLTVTQKTNGSTGSTTSTASQRKMGSPTAKRPKRRVKTISGPRFEGEELV